jgi:Glycosyl transferase family 2
VVSNSNPLAASIVIPTRARPDYLEVALASIGSQIKTPAAELIVVDDGGPSAQNRALAERFGARYESHPRPLGLNVARNTGVERSSGELTIFVDDDVRVCEGWLTALLAAAAEYPDVEVFTGPIVPRLEGKPPRSCGREGPPVTSLELGPHDTPTRFAWGTNMAIRRRALERIGPFDVSLEHGGDEQEWQERLTAERVSRVSQRAEPNGEPTGTNAQADHQPNHDGATSKQLPLEGQTPVLYVAGAAVEHRRAPADARLLALCRAARARGRAARRFDARRHDTPSFAHELDTLGGCLGHVARRRCPAGLVMVAHSTGRLEEALRNRLNARSVGEPHEAHSPPAPASSGAHVHRHATADFATDELVTDDFLSGESGTVGGLDGVLRATFDRGSEALDVLSGRRKSLARAAGESPEQRCVLVLGIERAEHHAMAQRIRNELARSRHRVELGFCAPGERGKFENLNRLLAEHPPHDHHWLFVVDDDIALPRGFLDRFLFLAERFRLDLAQPAHHHASHAAWNVTRRRRGSVVRETSFVEIGPVTAFARTTFSTLLPFPDLRMGWGLDMHWAALAREQGWRCGVIDAVAIRHRAAPAASAYSREQALAEARAFLEDRPHLSASQAQQTLTTHRRW